MKWLRKFLWRIAEEHAAITGDYYGALYCLKRGEGLTRGEAVAYIERDVKRFMKNINYK